jgi:hypothetical protein
MFFYVAVGMRRKAIRWAAEARKAIRLATSW